jgi:predicted phosphodiesterase
MKQPPASAPLAFLSDIHGNLEALEAVLAELRRRVIDRVYVAGDLFLGGDDPAEVYKRLMQVGAQCVQGLSDAALVKVDPDSLTPQGEEQVVMAAQFRQTRRELGELALKFLERLPTTRRVPLIDGSEILVVHGSPADPTVELSDDLSDEEMIARIDDDPADIVICGATHVPFQRALPETRVINVGSVGESPARVAEFTVVTPRVDGNLVEQTWVELP